jgi:exopolyphosphatase / guanosine-5'-triphosphate,3'-diphosphate pyrophosphatase
MANTTRNLAAIDVGTNSIHLIVVRVDTRTGRFKIIDREKDVVRLGEGSSDMKYLSRPAIRRGLASLSRFKRVANGAKAAVRAVGTSAIREAENKDKFLLMVKAKTGISIEIASGVEEARLIYLGILQALPVYQEKVLLIDVGGGSTEFLVGKKGQVLYDNSLKLGAVRLTERFFKKGEYSGKSVKQCREYIKGLLNPIARQLRKIDRQVAVGTSGTILAIAGLIRSERKVEGITNLNGFSFTADELKSAVAEIVDAALSDSMEELQDLDRERREIIVAGALIVEQLFEGLDLKEMTVSEYGLREGIVLDTIEKKYLRSESALDDLRRESILHLGDTLAVEKQHTRHVANLALRIFDQTRSLHKLGAPERELLEAAALLHEVGLFVSHSQHHRHSYYLIKNADLLGYTEDEKAMIANIARYHRKSHPKSKHENFQTLSEEQREVVVKLAAILRIADGLDRSHSGAVEDVVCRRSNGTIMFRLKRFEGLPVEMEIWGAEHKKGLFEKTFDLEVGFTDR